MVNHRAQNALGIGCPAPCGLIARGGRLRKVCGLRCASIISQSLTRSHQPSPAPCQKRKERGTLHPLICVVQALTSPVERLGEGL